MGFSKNQSKMWKKTYSLALKKIYGELATCAEVFEEKFFEITMGKTDMKKIFRGIRLETLIH